MIEFFSQGVLKILGGGVKEQKEQRRGGVGEGSHRGWGRRATSVGQSRRREAYGKEGNTFPGSWNHGWEVSLSPTPSISSQGFGGTAPVLGTLLPFFWDFPFWFCEIALTVLVFSELIHVIITPVRLMTTWIRKLVFLFFLPFMCDTMDAISKNANSGIDEWNHMSKNAPRIKDQSCPGLGPKWVFIKSLMDIGRGGSITY